jgi:glyoxylase-like metal-dependent hydrolase (beta-lactamase superfamily II)
MLHTRIFQFNPLGTNCMVLWADGSKTCTVADPGMSSDEGEQELLSFFAREGLTPDAILLTHGHFDHVWGVERLLARFAVPVYMNPADGGILRDGASAFRGMQSMKMLRHDFPTVDVADGDVVTTGGVSWKVIGTPGHTPGGVCYWSEDNNLLLSGDTLFAGSIGRTDLQGGDYDALMASIKDKLLNLPGETDVLPGHGQPTSIAREGMYNPFLEPFNEPENGDLV